MREGRGAHIRVSECTDDAAGVSAGLKDCGSNQRLTLRPLSPFPPVRPTQAKGSMDSLL